MKKLLIVVLMVSILAVAGIALAGISNTPHDLRILKNTLAVEPCAFCHTPHQGPNNVQINGVDAFVPLWNRSSATFVYTGYSSNTAQMIASGAGFALGQGTAECMVCHNGQVSVLVNYPGTDSTQQAAYNIAAGSISGWANIGTNLRNEHPVGFSYNNAYDSENNGFPNRITLAGNKNVIGAASYCFPLYGPVGAATQMECGSCHSVHHTFATAAENYKTVGGESYQVYFLRTSNVGSAMCRQCHVNR